MTSRQIRRAYLIFPLICLGVFGYCGVWLPLHSTGYDFTGPHEAAYASAHYATLQVDDVPMQRAFNAQVSHLPDGPPDFRWTAAVCSSLCLTTPCSPCYTWRATRESGWPLASSSSRLNQPNAL